jgi:hypothetical protein
LLDPTALRIYLFMFVAMEMEKPANKPRELVVQEQLLMTLESAYPNILPTDDLAQYASHILN